MKQKTKTKKKDESRKNYFQLDQQKVTPVMYLVFRLFDRLRGWGKNLGLKELREEYYKHYQAKVEPGGAVDVYLDAFRRIEKKESESWGKIIEEEAGNFVVLGKRNA